MAMSDLMEKNFEKRKRVAVRPSISVVFKLISRKVPPLVTSQDQLVPHHLKLCTLIIEPVDCYIASKTSGEYSTAFQHIGSLVL